MIVFSLRNLGVVDARTLEELLVFQVGSLKFPVLSIGCDATLRRLIVLPLQISFRPLRFYVFARPKSTTLLSCSLGGLA